MHITIKRQSSILDGPKLLFKEIQLVKSLNMRSDLCMIVLQSVQQNCSFSHPENVLLTMLADSDETIRSKAVSIIKKIRRSEANDVIREFHLPKVDMDAASYHQLAPITEVGRS